LRSLLRLSIGATLALILAGAAGTWWLTRWYDGPGPAAEAVVVQLPAGGGVRGIANRLAEAGAIDHPLWFELVARIAGRDKGLKAGEYRFEAGASPNAILRRLESGRILLHPLTLAEGLTVREMFDLLAESELLTGELPPLPPEGSLLPETYLVARGERRERVVSRMQSAMDAAIAEAWQGRAPGLPLSTPDEALVLASIIERETALADERPLVAAVFVNRLRRGMRLQTDPTVIYGLADGRGSLGRSLTRSDLATAHPYNTYLLAGLPPAPIANPGRAAIEAALHPPEVDYLYFVADGTGGHAFARTYEEHQRNVARWRQTQRAVPGAGNVPEAASSSTAQ
jgi:UPF0755 protein